MNKRFNEASEHGGESSKSRSVLSRLNEKDLKLIKVAIRRHNVTETTTSGALQRSSGALQRSLEKPEELHVHRKGKKPIFDREGIVVNNEEYLEERIVLKSPVHDSPDEGTSRRSRSKSYSDREHSRESYKSRNCHSYSRSPSKSRKDSDRPVKEYERGSKLSPSRDKQKSDSHDYRGKSHAEGSRKRSLSPHYKRSESERYEYKSRVPSEKYYRERSPKAGTSRGGGERERSPKERRDSDSFRKDKYKLSPRRSDYRESPKRYERHRSRSPSPKKAGYKNGDRDKYTRARTPPNVQSKRHSISPHRRRSPSPYSRKHSPSPHSRRRSRSPHFKKSPPREERSFGGSSSTASKIRRRSGSPYDKEKSYVSSTHRSGYNKPTHSKRRTPSPYTRRHSRSPHRSRKRSRSPSRREGYSHSHRRSRSPHKTRKHSESDERYERSPSGDRSEYRGMPPDFRYYGPEGYWIPGPMPRPGFIPRPVIPPHMGMARGVFPPEPYMFPRPYLPMPHPIHPFRQRFPQYNRPHRPRISAPTIVSTTTATTTTTTNAVAHTSTATVVVASAEPVVEESSKPIIEECTEDDDSAEKS